MLTKWREKVKKLGDITISYKLTKFPKVEKSVDLHLTAVFHNKGERQKGTHQRTSLSTAVVTV